MLGHFPNAHGLNWTDETVYPTVESFGQLYQFCCFLRGDHAIFILNKIFCMKYSPQGIRFLSGLGNFGQGAQKVDRRFVIRTGGSLFRIENQHSVACRNGAVNGV